MDDWEGDDDGLDTDSDKEKVGIEQADCCNFQMIIIIQQGT